MSELHSYSSAKSSSGKEFGVLAGLLLLALGIYFLSNDESAALWLFLASFSLLMVAAIKPRLLSIPNKLWIKLKRLLTSGALLIVYFLVIIPLGLLSKGLGKDPLSRRIDKKTASYWIKRSKSDHNMKDQF